MNIHKRKSSKGTVSYQVKVRKSGLPPQIATFKTKHEAKAWGTQIEAQMITGQYVDVTKKHSLTYILQCYLKNATGNLTKGSVDNYTGVVNRVEEYFGNTRIDRIGYNQFMAYFEWRASTLKPSSVGREQGVIFTMLGKCETLPLVDNNRINILPRLGDMLREGLKLDGASERPVHRVRRVADFEWELLMSSQMKQNAARARLEKFKLCCEFAIETCMREGEIAALQRPDIDSKKGTIKIRKSKTDRHQKIKGRVIPLSKRAKEIILQLPPRLDGSLFGYRNAAAISSKWGRESKKLGLVDLHFHDFRHEGISQLFDLGWGIEQVAAVSGHTDWKSLAIYTHLNVGKLNTKLSEAPQAKMQAL
jgi:hypothetical protein